MTTAEGLRIACLGGTYKPEIYHGSEIPHVRVYTHFNSLYLHHRDLGILISLLYITHCLETAFQHCLLTCV
jgi:hypothetical protein